MQASLLALPWGCRSPTPLLSCSPDWLPGYPSKARYNSCVENKASTCPPVVHLGDSLPHLRRDPALLSAAQPVSSSVMNERIVKAVRISMECLVPTLTATTTAKAVIKQEMMKEAFLYLTAW